MIQKVRLCLFNMAFRGAHDSLHLPPKVFATKDLPVCYLKESYAPEQIRALDRYHMVVGKNEYVFWFKEGDQNTYWVSTAANNIDEFIRQFYREKIFGEFAPYSLIVTQMLHGQYIEFVKNGKVGEFERKKLRVQNKLSFFLNNYFYTTKYKLLKFLIKLAS